MTSVKDIAALAGISASTVSVVLNGKSEERKISVATQQKVWDAVRQLNYKPNISARRLRYNQENSIVVALFWTTDFRAPMMVRFLRGIHQELASMNRRVEIIIYPYQNDALQSVFSQPAMNLFNAAIVCNASDKDLAFLEASTFQFPLVLYNRRSTRYSTVNVDDHQLGKIAAEVFISRKHRQAAILTSGSVFSGMQDRIDSFTRAFELGCGEVLNPLICDNSMRGGYQGIRQLLSGPNRPDCLFCASDYLAIGALKALKEGNIRIPEDLELISVGNGDQELEEYASTALSVVYLPMEAMAATCLRVVFDFLDHRQETPTSVELPLNYKARESCGDLA